MSGIGKSNFDVAVLFFLSCEEKEFQTCRGVSLNTKSELGLT